MLERWTASWRELGALDGTLYAVNRLLRRLSAGRARVVKYRFVAQPIGASNVQPPRDDPSTHIQATRLGDPVAGHFPRPQFVIARRFNDGAHCLTATVRGEFAGFIWWQRERYVEDEVRCTYVLDDALRCVWDFDVYVEPRFRIGRTLARLWAAADRRLQSEGVDWTFSRISAFNSASMKAHARLGAIDRGWALFIVLGQSQLALMSQAPWCKFSAGRMSGPCVVLHCP